MITYLLYPGHIFRRHDKGLPLAFVGNCAPKLNDAITDHDIDLRCPGLLVKFGLDLVANSLIR